MYKIIKKDAVLGIVSNLTWVCMQDNGCYGLTVEDNAQGIALNGTVYHVNGHPELDGAETVSVEEVDDGVYASSLTALLTDPNDLRNSEQFRKAVQMFAKSLDEDSAMMIATIYDPYQVGHAYAVGDYFTYGVNGVGDPQLYKVVQAHTSQADWKPDTLPALYTPIGLTPSGYPVWTQPTGAHDAYNKGDIVSYNDKLYRSLIDGNVYSPDAYPAGWEVKRGQDMSDAILVAIITGGLSLLGIIYSSGKSASKVDAKLDKQQAVIETKLNELTREVREHNNFARRVPVVEEQIKVINRRIEDLEGFHKPA